MQALPLRNVPFPLDVSLPWASNQEKFFVIPYASCYKGFFSLLSRISRIQLCILSVIHCAPLLSGEKTLSRYFTPAPLQVIFCWCSLIHFMLPVQLWWSTWLECPDVKPVSSRSLWKLYSSCSQVLAIPIFSTSFLSVLLQ